MISPSKSGSSIAGYVDGVYTATVIRALVVRSSSIARKATGVGEQRRPDPLALGGATFDQDEVEREEARRGNARHGRESRAVQERGPRQMRHQTRKTIVFFFKPLGMFWLEGQEGETGTQFNLIGDGRRDDGESREGFRLCEV